MPGVSSRQALLSFIAGSKEFVALWPDLLHELRSNREAGPNLRLHFPPKLLEGLQRGDLFFKDALDGSGLLPIAFNVENERFAKQVRLVPDDLADTDRSRLGTAAADAVTQALLREVLEKLEVIDRKLDRVLANQRADAIGQIVAGQDELERALAEPGHGPAFIVSLGNAAQSVREGMKKLLGQFQELVREVPEQTSFFRKMLSAPTNWTKPSVGLARKLDAIQDDLYWLFTAARTLGRIDEQLGRPQAALREVKDLQESLRSVTQPCFKSFRRAHYDERRDAFWSRELPHCLAIRDADGRGLVVEVTIEEVNKAVAVGDRSAPSS